MNGPALLDGLFMRGELIGAVELLIHPQDGVALVLFGPDEQRGGVAVGLRVFPQDVGPMCGVGVFHGRPGLVTVGVTAHPELSTT